MLFRNGGEIAAYYQRMLDQGKTGELKKLLQSSSQTLPLVAEDELRDAADALKAYLLEHIERYFASYNPVIYQRTGQFLDSIDIDVTKENGKLQAKVRFDPSKTVRDSLFEGGAQGDTVLLLDQGWTVQRDVWFKDIPHFGFFEGTHFIESALKDAQDDPRFANIKIELSDSLNGSL